MSDYNDGILPEPCLRMDTHFGDEYESIEFGDGTGYIKAALILAKVGALHEEIDRLRDESAKLRELVWDMWDWLAPTAVGGGAPLKRLHNRMRELGGWTNDSTGIDRRAIRSR